VFDLQTWWRSGSSERARYFGGNRAKTGKTHEATVLPGGAGLEIDGVEYTPPQPHQMLSHSNPLTGGRCGRPNEMEPRSSSTIFELDSWVKQTQLGELITLSAW
jgi:hypothetical protein